MGIMFIKHVLEAELKYLCTIGQGTDSFQGPLRAQCLPAATLACSASTQTQHLERVDWFLCGRIW